MSYSSLVLAHPALLSYFRLQGTVSSVYDDDKKGTFTSGVTTSGSLTFDQRPGSLQTDLGDAAIRFGGNAYMRWTNPYTNGWTKYLALALTNRASVEAWFKHGASDNTGSTHYITQAGNFGGFQLKIASGALQAGAYLDNSMRTATAPSAYADDSWHHAVLTYDAAVLRLYVDGALAASTNFAGTTTMYDHSTYRGVWIGHSAWYGGFFTGYIDEVAYYNDAISAGDVAAHYEESRTNNFHQLTLYAQPISYWTFDSTIEATDDAGGGDLNSGTYFGNPVAAVGAVPQLPQYGVELDGSNDYVAFDATLDETPGRFSLMGWVYPLESGRIQNLFSDTTAEAVDGISVRLTTGNQLEVFLNAVGHTSTATLPTNEWSFVVITYDASTLRLYVDGALDSSAARSAPTFSSGRQMQIGKQVDALNQVFRFAKVRIDEWAWFGRVLSGGEITQLYQVGQESDSVAFVASASMSSTGVMIIDSEAVAFNGKAGLHGVAPFIHADPVSFEGSAEISVFGSRTVVAGWTTMPSFPTDRYAIGAAASANKVWAFAGFNSSSSATALLDEFDIATQTWTTKANFITTTYYVPTVYDEATNALYVFGGQNSSTSVYKYVIASNGWTFYGSMTQRLNQHTGDRIGRDVFLHGYTSISHKWNLDSKVETSIAPIPTWHGASGAASWEGKLYVFGGNNRQTGSFVYDPITDTWSSIAALPAGRDEHGATAKGNYIYIVGGDATDASPSPRLYRYDPRLNSYTLLDNMPAGRRIIQTSVTANERIWVVGGYTGTASSNTLYRYTVAAENFPTTTLAGTGTVLVGPYGFATITGEGTITASAEARKSRSSDVGFVQAGGALFPEGDLYPEDFLYPLGGAI